MIYIPKENIERVENEDDSDFIFWYFNDNVTIVFEWMRTPKIDDAETVYYVKDNDPFYLRVVAIGRENVQKCSEAACQCYPQLRYNNILSKWYCTCPSSTLGVGNTDVDEAKDQFIMKLRRNRQIDEEHGFFDNPVQAVLYWNVDVLKALLKINEGNFDLYKENGKFL